MKIVIYDHHIFIVQVDQWSLVVQDIFSAYTAAAKSWCLLKLFTAFRNKLECLSLLVASSQVKHLQAKPELTRVRFNSNVGSHTCLQILDEGGSHLHWKNSLTYYDVAQITAVKIFITQAPFYAPN